MHWTRAVRRRQPLVETLRPGSAHAPTPRCSRPRRGVLRPQADAGGHHARRRGKPTRLRVSASHPCWEVFTLAAHINVATHMVQDLIADTAGGAPGMIKTTFFVTDVAQVAPAVDTFTRNSAKGLSDALRQTLWRPSTRPCRGRARPTRARWARRSSGRCAWMSSCSPASSRQACTDWTSVPRWGRRRTSQAGRRKAARPSSKSCCGIAVSSRGRPTCTTTSPSSRWPPAGGPRTDARFPILQ